MTGNGVGNGKTIAALAAVLEVEGIDVADHSDNEEEMDAPNSSIVFCGDDLAGGRAMELAWAHDYQPQGLARDWMIVGGEMAEPHWMMLFD